jgi:hypothetical protein
MCTYCDRETKRLVLLVLYLIVVITNPVYSPWIV